MIEDRPLTEADYPVFLSIAEESPVWKQTELNGMSIDEYIENYEHLNGQWSLWTIQEEAAAISFLVKNAPSNGKPWLGTVLVKAGCRGKGLGSRIISQIGKALESQGEDVMFCGVPLGCTEWQLFLGKCGFEQFKIEEDDEGVKQLVFVKPL